ncbi:MAG: hypothetical protein ACFFCS_07925 [Candidatus Hodarchaeota archaeon]
MNSTTTTVSSEKIGKKKNERVNQGRGERRHVFKELITPVVIMGMTGVFYWAIRGTGGYGGSAGGGFAGVGWAMCWYFLAYEKGEVKRRAYSTGWIVAAITFGVWFGGMHGWGQFNSWIKCDFDLGSSITAAINPAWGWVAHFQCGFAWGGNTGILMGWCASRKRVTWLHWWTRILFAIGGAIASIAIFYILPGLTLPLYNQGIYSSVSCDLFGDNTDICRTYSTAFSSSILFGIYVGLLVHEIIRKNWRNVKLALVMATGFGLSQTIAALWHFGYGTFPDLLYQEWWKAWEMTTGFGHGITLGICYFLFNRPIQEDKLINSRKQPFSLHRTAERELGVNFALVWGLSIAIQGGLEGLGKSIDVAELFGFTTSKGFTADQIAVINDFIVDVITIIIVMLLIFKLLLNWYGSHKKPSLVLDGKANVRYPGTRFWVVQIVLIISGVAAAISTFPLSHNEGVLLAVYGITLFIGLSFSIVRWIIVAKVPKDNCGLDQMMKDALDERRRKSIPIKVKNWINSRPTKF